VDPHRLEGDLLRCLRCEQLRHARLEVRSLPPVFRLRRLDHQQPRRLGLRRHLRELELDRLMLRDWLPERVAFLRVANRLLEGAGCDSHGARGNVHAPELDCAHEVLEPLSDAGLAAEDARRRRAETVEDELGRLDALVAELAERRRNRESRLLGSAGLLLDDERRHPAVRRIGVRVGLGEQHHHPRLQPVRRPHLLAGDHVLVALPDRARPDRLDVRPCVRLRHRIGRVQLACRHPRQEALPLLLRAVRLDHPGREKVRVEHAREGHPAA
jgi:hypothetical protein